MDSFRTLATLVPLAVAAGVNLYATVLVAGLCVRYEWVAGIPADLHVLGAWPIIVVAGILFLLEALADKIQFVDNAWDLLHSVIRPLGAAGLALAVLGDVDPVWQVLAALFAGTAAFATHATKASARVAVNVTSPLENVSNVIVSTTEDAAVAGVTWLALAHPYVALVIALVVLAVVAIVGPILIRWAWFCAKALLARIKAIVDPVTIPDVLPATEARTLEGRVATLTARCKSQGVPRARGRTGHLSVVGSDLAFTWESFGGPCAWGIPLGSVIDVALRPRVLVDVIELRWREGKRKRRSRFVFGKDRSILARELAARIGAK